jgi:hypothetical protein
MIKACARLGQTELPPIVPPTGQEDLFRYVIARLLWDPFLDVSQLKREFARQAAPR